MARPTFNRGRLPMPPEMRARMRAHLDAAEAERLSRIRSGTWCPDCGERDRLQDNGEEGPERTFRCEVCDAQWDATFRTEI